MKIGLQLYNFRNALKEDFRGALKEIAKLGADGVEFAVNYGGLPPEELKAFLKELKLECAGTMFKVDDLVQPDNAVYQYAKALNTPAVTISAFGSTVEEWDATREKCRIIGANAAKYGTVFSYHNHWTEFGTYEGQTFMDRILENTDPKQVFMEPDICWLTRSGVDPIEFIRKYANRIRQIHIKDIKVPTDVNTTTELGTGIVKVAPVLAMVHEIPCQWVIYEQDMSADPFRSAAESLAFMKKNLVR